MATATEIAEVSNGLSDYIQSDRRRSAQGGPLTILPTALALAVIVAINLVCFSRSLSGYFLADDFIHIAYLANVCNGHLDQLGANFTGNWMHAQGTQFYRPIISLTLAADYLTGHGQPFWFHLTNIAYQTASSILLFVLTRRLTRAYPWQQSLTVAAATGAFFAACPLHPEVASWVIGRVDSVCTTFYLAAFYLFLVSAQERNKLAMATGLACFALSLGSKEMAITLPAVLSLLCLVAPAVLTGSTKHLGLKERLLLSWRSTWPFWSMLVGYMGLRLAALGVLFGGYSGSIADGYSGSLLSRITSDGSVSRIFYPLNLEVFTNPKKMFRLFNFAYAAVAGLLLARTLVYRRQSGLSALLPFAVIWFVVSMLPALGVFNITGTLQCSRFIYMGTAPLALALALALFPLGGSTQSVPRQFPVVRLDHFRWAAALVSACILVLFVQTTYKNNLPWVHASNDVRTFRQEIENACKDLPADQKLVVMTIPQRKQGAHMIYNAAMLSILLSPPLSPVGLAQRIVTFEPVTYGDSSLVNNARLERLVADHPNYKFCRWQEQAQKLEMLSFPAAAGAAAGSPPPSPLLDADSLNQGLRRLARAGRTIRLQSGWLDLPTLPVKFVSVTLTARPRTKPTLPPTLYLFWTDDANPVIDTERVLSLPVVADGKPHTYKFSVGERKSWLASGRIRSLELELPFMGGQSLVEPDSLQLTSVEVSNGEDLIPRLTAAAGLNEGSDGVTQATSRHFSLSFNAATIPGAQEVILEISHPDAWFEHYSGTMHDEKLSTHTRKTLKSPARQGTFNLSTTDFAAPGYYQLRAAALDKQGHMLGYTSDPINLQLAAVQLARQDRSGGERTKSN